MLIRIIHNLFMLIRMVSILFMFRGRQIRARVVRGLELWRADLNERIAAQNQAAQNQAAQNRADQDRAAQDQADRRPAHESNPVEHQIDSLPQDGGDQVNQNQGEQQIDSQVGGDQSHQNAPLPEASSSAASIPIRHVTDPNVDTQQSLPQLQPIFDDDDIDLPPAVQSAAFDDTTNRSAANQAPAMNTVEQIK